MDFTHTPPPPLEFGKPKEFFERLAVPTSGDAGRGQRFYARIRFDNESRDVAVGFSNHQATEFEFLEVVKGDTFDGIPIPMRTTKFRNRLKKISITSVYKNGAVNLPDLAVSFYEYAGAVATICWSCPSAS